MAKAPKKNDDAAADKKMIRSEIKKEQKGEKSSKNGCK